MIRLNSAQKLLCCTMLFLDSSMAGATMALCAAPAEQTYEAVVRFIDGSTDKVRAKAKDFYDARKAIERSYCGGAKTSSCIVEGPWTVH